MLLATVTQPGPFDGGKVPADVIAKLSKLRAVSFPDRISWIAPSRKPRQSGFAARQGIWENQAPVVPAVLNMLVKSVAARRNSRVDALRQSLLR